MTSGGKGPSRRRSGRSSQAQTVVVRLTEPAFGELEQLLKKDPRLVRQALKKMLLLERDPEAGEPLQGGLIGLRKLVLGDRDRRLVWRVTHDDSGTVIVDVAEVWAIGARGEGAVHEEMWERVDKVRGIPSALALADVVERLGKVARTINPRPEHAEQVPEWLPVRLREQAGLTQPQIEAMAPKEALDAWTA